MMNEEQVILVNGLDQAIGVMGKMQAHEQGLLHRAFSVFIFNQKGEMLLQQRALDKYHSAGLWTNACCSHPRPGEAVAVAANRRLKEEMGFETGLSKIFDFVYEARFDNGLREHEFDHVFTGCYDGPVCPNKNEVMNYAFRPLDAIRHDISQQPGLYTEWFKLAFPQLQSWWHQVAAEVKGEKS